MVSMKRRTLMILLAALVLVGTAALLEAQRGRQGRNGRNGGFGGFGGFGGGRNFRYGQNEPPPDSEFIFARLRYTAHGKFGGSGWSHDYPTAEEHINQIMAEATGVHVESTSIYRAPRYSNILSSTYPKPERWT
jgi:hypothetical protein